MSEHEISHVVWDENHRRIEVMFAEGEPARMLTDELVATVLARDAGLVLVDTSPGVMRWSANPTPVP